MRKTSSCTLMLISNLQPYSIHSVIKYFLYYSFFESFRKFFIRSDSVIFCSRRSPDTAVFPEDLQLKVLDGFEDTIPCPCTFTDNAEFFTKNWGFSFIFNHILTPDCSHLQICICTFWRFTSFAESLL